MDYKRLLASALSECVTVGEGELYNYFETPPESTMGDFAFPCFKLAKTLRKSPGAIAGDIVNNISLPADFSKVEALGGYVNFFISRRALAKSVMDEVLSKGAGYGSSVEGEGKTICIDYSSINIAKPFHIGHLSSTVIGGALYKIYEFLGYKCVGINHMGDWGTQFGKLISAYKRWGNRDEVEKGSIKALLKLYVRFHEEAEKDDSLNDEARAYFKRIEDGDEEALALFTWFKELTLKEISKIYELLNVHFDSYAGESFYNDKLDAVVDELRAKNLLKLDNGAHIVDLEEYSMPPCIILRSDGASLYATRDIAAAMYRKKTYDFYKSLYVVAYQQNLHFKQVFKVIELMGYDWAKDMEHVAFGMVSMAEGTLSTRNGTVVFLEDVLNASIQKTLEIIREKSPELENKERVAKQVGVGAIVFSALYNGRIKDVVFSWDKALSFEGETAPYAQYTHARLASVIAKAGALSGQLDYDGLCDDASQALLKAIAAFPDTVRESAQKNEPYLIARIVIEICSLFNKFYFENRITCDDENLRYSRVKVCEVTRSVIKTGLRLLGVEAPDKM